MQCQFDLQKQTLNVNYKRGSQTSNLAGWHNEMPSKLSQATNSSNCELNDSRTKKCGSTKFRLEKKNLPCRFTEHKKGNKTQAKKG